MEDVALIRGGPEFVGRGAELARLDRLAGDAAAGSARAVLVGGDAGVGKTRLTAELVQRAAQQGAVAAVGRCVDLGAGGLPYLPFAEAFAGLAADPVTAATIGATAAERPTFSRLAGRGDPAPAADDAQQRLSLFEAVAAALRATAAAAPGVLLFVLEDLHWADASTRDLLRFLLARLSDERLLVVATYRSDDLHRRHPLRPLLAELARLPAVDRLELAPFDAVELRDYLRLLHGGELAERVVRDIGRRSEGNAFYAAELLGALDDAGRRSLPEALADILLARLEQLPEPVQRVARIAAVAGRRVPDHLLRAAFVLSEAPDPQATGRPEGAPSDRTGVEQALREAVAHHVLVPDGGDRFAFRHALVQEAVYADLLPGERSRLHGVYARLLACAPSPDTAVDLARHSVEAHDEAGALAAWLLAAREAERRLAPAEATAHYSEALRLWPQVTPTRRPADTDAVDVALAAAQAASGAGELRRAAAFAEQAVAAAAATGDTRVEARARHRLASVRYLAEQDDAAMAEIRSVYRLLTAHGPSPERVWAATVEARVRVGWGDVWEARREHLVRGAEMVESALADARALGMAAAEADLLISLAATDGIVTGPQAAEERLAEAMRCGRAAGDRGTVLRASYVLAVNRLDAGDLAGAQAVLIEALGEADREGLASSTYGTEARSLLAQVQGVRGDWDDALRTVGDDRPPLPARQALFLTVPTLPVTAARDPAAALERVRLLIDCDRDYPLYWHLLLVPKADALLWLGDPRGALSAVRETLESFGALGRPLIIGGLSVAAVGLAALAELAFPVPGSPAEPPEPPSTEAVDLLEHARRVAQHGPTRLRTLGPEGRAWLLRAEAEASRLTSGPHGAGDVDAWRAAHQAFGYGHVYELARTGWRLAAALLARGDDGDAREATELARSARQTAVRLGAGPLREAVDALAGRYRLDIGAPRPAGALLTARESQVIGLVAQGLTNREIGARLFISEKTASVHVSNLMAKLGATGRAEAVSLAYRRGLLGSGAAPTVGA